MAEPNDELTNKKGKLDSCDTKSLFLLLNICSGTLDLPDDEQVTLTVGNRSMNIMNITPDDYAFLDSNLDVAYYFGEEDEKILNTDIRKSKHTDKFTIDLHVRAIMRKLNVDGVTDERELNYYKTGDFFLPHRDTNRRRIMGTFILLLPSEYVGGELCFGDYNVEENMDKSKLRFIYFNGELEHSVTKVLSGNRLSVVYNVYDLYNIHHNDDIIPKAININFSDECYKQLLDYTIKFCEGKKNILLGYYNHRNDVFERLLIDIKSQCEVIQVTAHRKSPISTIPVLIWSKNRDPSNDDIILERDYDVGHILFAEHCNLTSNTLTKEDGCTGISPDYKKNVIDHQIAYLINPEKDN